MHAGVIWRTAKLLAQEEEMRNSTMVVIGVIGLFGVGGAVAHGRQGGGRGAAQAVPDAPIGKTAFWTNEDIQAR